ncbi:MAG: hypothetical protein A2Y79_01585 [Deltaproteobacteria bacterium RBG_13_43_22]|nr:MAG: hypothetical protein A2Y79_01585 [Deltaproteobacteria bacterium RBG_13_43_22]
MFIGVPFERMKIFKKKGRLMKKGFWIGLSILFGLLIVLSSVAQEGVLWVDKFSEGKVVNDVPAGWKLEKKTGDPELKVQQSGGDSFVRFRSDNSSFGLKKEMDFDIKDYPYLNWRWKVTRLPEKGDFLKKDTDDQAAQVYVLFPRFPAKLNTEIVGYLWESNPKNKGREGESPAWSKSKVIVLQAGPEKLNQWVQEKRNVYEDYKKLFKKEPPKSGGIALYINTQHTQGKAESYFGPIYFSKN